jgi:hypothetical protein
MLGILALLCGLGALICAIIVLIKLFQEKGALHGILGFLCGLYTFIWGWMNASRLGIKNIMVIWTLLIILYCVFGALGGGFSYSFGTPTTP